MNHYTLIIILTFFMCVFAIYNFKCITEFNPFNGYIKIPNKFVESFSGPDMNLLKTTDKTNPLINLENKNKKIRKQNHGNLLFTSAGDNTNFDELWINDNQEYDIMVVYYGNKQESYDKYSKKVDWILKRKGSKFQNFHHIYKNHKDIIDKYDRYFILDDDIIFDYKDINKMFYLSRKHDFWICGPTYKKSPECKISYKETLSRANENILFRYTNFVEVGVPLFNKEALDKFMKIYDPVLIGWGIDFLYIWICDMNNKKRFALIDSVECINPQDNKKMNKTREMYQVNNFSNERNIWIKFSKKYEIPKLKVKTWEIVNK
jgi:hypothetical protein